MTNSLKIGSNAPSFTADAIGGEYTTTTSIDLDSLRGHTVVLYFYPKDDTPGCTQQACALRDGWATISNKVKLFGISINSIASHSKFISKYQLPFPILSDEDHRIAEAYGVWVEKRMYGRAYMGTERTTFIIAPDGTIKAILPKVKPSEHLAQVMELI